MPIKGRVLVTSSRGALFSSRRALVGLIGGLIAVTTVLHHVTPVDVFALHNLYQRLYYLPIFLAAYWFGFRAAIFASFISAASFLPHILVDWRVIRGLHDEYYKRNTSSTPH